MGRDVKVGEWLVQPDLNRISMGEKTVAVEPKVIEVLAYLAGHPGEVLPREKILKSVWPDTYVTDEVLTYSISELRKAFEDDAKNPKIIQTIPRRGYRLIAPVTQMDQYPEQVKDADQRSEQTPASPKAGRSVGWSVGLGALAVVAFVGVLLFVGPIRFRGPYGPPEGKIVLVVLPLENLVGDPEQEYFSDGLTEELITQVGRLQPERLRVIARTSAMQYKKSRRGIDQIGRELGVNYVLEGSVRREENRVRISVKLIQVRDQTQLWTESYDRELSGIITVQNEVAKAVANQIQITLSETEQVRLDHPRLVIPEALEAYLKGTFSLNRRTPLALHNAAQFFETAIRKDPAYAAAYAGLADTYILLNEYSDLSPTEAYGKARAAAAKALELDNELAEAHAAMGMIQYSGDWDWPTAEKTFKHAISLNPNYPQSYHWYCNLLSTQGRLEEAQAAIQRAIQIDSLSVIPRVALAWRVYGAMRKYDPAIREIRAVLEMDPSFGFAHRRLVTLYLLTGRHEDALQQAEAGRLTSDRGPFTLADLGYCYAVTGKTAEVRKIIDELQQLSRNGYVDAERLALIYTGLGEKDKALDQLEIAFRRRDVGMLVIKPDPRFDPLRDQSRFKALLRAMKLPD